MSICALLSACAPAIIDTPEQWRAVDVETAPVALGAERVGRLRFRGGVEISSADEVFGGISDLEVLDDNRILAISDNGDWFEARLVLNEAGDLVGVSDVRSAFMRDENGRLFPTKRHGDSEDLSQLPDGRFAVSFEQTQSIRIYDFNRDGPFGAARPGPRLAGVERLHRNAGLEAIAATAEGALLVGAEGGEQRTTPLWLAPLDAQAPVEPRIGYPAALGYSLTALDRLPDGGFVALERFYAPVIGARARITMFPETSLAARGEALPALTVLAELAPPMPVDNFEGIAAQRLGSGATRIYVVSDDNFSDRQRTLLYAFDVSSVSSSR
ncbi:esterase-like activity of phytase family protein [Vitreimonas sp.]|uniref:esterase-like activity of phytase family protein n=1 Tax=Vitreimonas sp. TaxID=3069702 RepID=UPI002D772265|nr:esterase-like activity of phytase family protein [Vitreimonas sp.]